MTPIPLSRPPVDDEIKQAVLAAIDSRQYVLGPQCRQLEAELAAATGVKHAVLTSSATAALWLTLRALGVKKGDEILVPSHTAFPTVEAICLAEATPVFVDADEFYTLDPDDAKAKVTSRTVGVVPVHVRPTGRSCGRPGPHLAPRPLAARGLRPGAGRGVERATRRQLRPRGGLFFLSVEESPGHGRRGCRPHRRR